MIPTDISHGVAEGLKVCYHIYQQEIRSHCQQDYNTPNEFSTPFLDRVNENDVTFTVGAVISQRSRFVRAPRVDHSRTVSNLATARALSK